MSSTLFRSQQDSEFNQRSFALKFFPMHALSESTKKSVIFNRFEWMSKKEVEGRCNADKNRLFFRTRPHADLRESTWEIVWVNNNMPSEADWSKVEPETGIFIEFRITASWGRVAILTFSDSKKSRKISGISLI